MLNDQADFLWYPNNLLAHFYHEHTTKRESPHRLKVNYDGNFLRQQIFVAYLNTAKILLIGG